MKNQKLITLLVLFGLLISTSCTKLEFAPENAQSAEDMYDTKEDFKDVLNSAYDLFGNSMNGTVQNFNELLGENLTDIQIAGSGLEYFAIYSRGTITFRTGDCFGLYQGILRVNTVMENLKTNKPGFTQTEIDQIEAECLFLRAWMHWEMVKLYAQPYGYTADNSHPGIPLRLVSTYEIELRSSVQKVYDQIIADLKIAESKLPLSNGNYANKWAAKGLLSKIYFQMHNYDQAFNYADDVIKQSGYTLSDSINRFNPGAESEIIFSIVSNLGNNKSGTFTGNYRSDQNPNPPFKISKEVIYKMFNDTLDKRKALYMAQKANTPFEFWVTKKFNRDVFNIPLIHLTDLYLIRAESFVEKGSKVDGYNDLMLIRNRSYGNGNRSFNPNASGVSVRDSIRLERRLEMIGEGDWTQQLKRMGSQGENITIRGAAWNCPGMILQFPASFKTEGFIFNKEGGCN